MLINNLRTASFRNLADDDIFTGSKDVFLVGENGQGKTNFLEAVYYCSYASSFRSVNDGEIARNGERDFSVEIKLVKNSIQYDIDNIMVKHENGKKEIFIDGKRAEDRKELLSVSSCIVFCHEDMEFVSGSPEKRRWFFDQTLSLYDPVYLDDFRCYRRVLKMRNAVLRDFQRNVKTDNTNDVLNALDPQLAAYGQKIMEKRKTAIEKFSGVLCPLYEDVSGIKGVTVQYSRSWPDGCDFTEYLYRRRPSDMAAGITLSGPHRDRYVFMQDNTGMEFAGKASTGQRRLLALLLRIAQARRYTEMTGISPVLLLDDVLLEMDGEKRRRFLTMLPDYDQAFFTFLPEEPYLRYSKNDTLIYKVENGKAF